MDLILNNLQEKQNKLFLKLLDQLKSCNTYHGLCLDRNIKLSEITSINDIKYLPIINKDYLHLMYRSGWLGVSNDKIVRMHATSGTTGAPLYVPYTKTDLTVWSNLIVRSLLLSGVHCLDKVFIALPYGIFTGGLGFQKKKKKMGCATIPAGASNVDKHIQIIQHLNPNVIIATPSYALHLFESYFQKVNKKPDFRIGIFGGECWTQESKQFFEQFYNIKAYNCYGLAEIMGPGVAHEGSETQGKLAIWEDHFFPEIINPVTLNTVQEGEWGELVITTLTKQAAPLMRYRTHDITRFTGERYHGNRLIDRIHGRSDDLLIIRGVNIYPTQFEKIILTFHELSSSYLIEISRNTNLDKVIIKCELKQECDYKNTDTASFLSKSLQTKVKNYLGISVEVIIVDKGVIPQSPGKSKRILDLRK